MRSESWADKLAATVEASGTPALFVKPRGVGAYTSVPNFNDIGAITAAVDEATKQAKPAKAAS